MLSPNDTFLALFNFEVRLTPTGWPEDEDFTRTADFSEVTGLEINLEAQDLREGGYNVGSRRLVGRTSSPPLVLKRGLTRDAGFWSWVQNCFSGKYPLPYLDGQIVVHAPNRAARQHRAVWRFTNGIATKVSGPSLNATSVSEVPIEELHIVHEGLTREVPT